MGCRLMMVTMTLTEAVNVLVALERMSAHDARCRAYDKPDSELSGSKPADPNLCNCQIKRKAQTQADALGQAGLLVGVDAPPAAPRIVSPPKHVPIDSDWATIPAGNYQTTPPRNPPRLHRWPRWGKSSRF